MHSHVLTWKGQRQTLFTTFLRNKFSPLSGKFNSIVLPLVTALPNGNTDEEPPRHGKWSGQHIPVETSVDNNDGDLRQTGVT